MQQQKYYPQEYSNNQSFRLPEQRSQRQPEPKKKEGGVNLFNLLLKVVFSPIIFIVIGIIIFKDMRRAVLLALMIITVLHVFSLILKLLKLGISAMTMNIAGFIKTSIDIIIAIVFTAIYWVIYIAVYGTNFNF
jgi:hypothetical protein